MRPSCFTNYFRLQNRGRRMVTWFDRLVLARHARARARRHGTRRHMLTAIPRYGARVIPNTEQTIAGDSRRAASSSKDRTSQRSSTPSPRGWARAHAVTASYGRMAFYYLLAGAAIAAGIGDRLPGADVLGRAGAGARRRPDAGVRGCRSAHVHAGSGGVRARDHAADARRRPDAPLWPARATWTPSSASRAGTGSR